MDQMLLYRGMQPLPDLLQPWTLRPRAPVPDAPMIATGAANCHAASQRYILQLSQ
jgi:hypothetical protein